MKKIIQLKVHLTIGYPTADHDDVIEVEIDDSWDENRIEQEKENETREWANNYIEYYYEEI